MLKKNNIITFIGNKKLVILVCLLFSTISVFAKGTATPAVVTEYFAIIAQLQTSEGKSHVYDCVNKMKKCFAYSEVTATNRNSSGIQLANDLLTFTGIKQTSHSSSLYCNYLCTLLTEKGLKVEAEIKESTISREVDLPEYRIENTPIIHTTVKKKMSKGGVLVESDETYVSQNNLIYVVENSWSVNLPKSISSLRANAALLFTQGKYKMAYQTYLQILSQDNKDANAYYRLGILAFWYGKKCGLSDKESKDNGIAYMSDALRLGAVHADMVLFYMTHKSTI